MAARELAPFDPAAPAPPPPAPPVGRWIGAGLVLAALGFGGFGAWAALAPLTSAALAPGMVTVDSQRKTLQHPEGGIIREILVRDGDQVREGQVLLRLDMLDAQADRDSLRGQLDAVMAREARLAAQRDGLAEIAFPPELLARAAAPALAAALEGQTRILADQARSLQAESEVWQQRIRQHEAQIAAVRAESAALKQQLPSLEEELAAITTLVAQGHAPRPRMLALQREVAAVRGDIAANDSRVEALRQQIVEAGAQIDALRRGRARAVSEELREVQTRRAEIEELFRKTEARAARRDVLAPQDGAVMNLRYVTADGVVPPGGALLDLVPADDKLVLDVRVQPTDVDVVRPGLPATVRLVAYKQRSTPTLEGRVTRLSADVVLDERSGTGHFLATVEVAPDELARLPHVALHPGMPVEVAIVTGRRTLLDYLLQPLTESFAHAFRED